MGYKILTLFLALIAGCLGAEQSANLGGRTVTVTDLGGSIAVRKNDNATQSLTIAFHSVKEVTSDGTEIGTAGSAKHSFDLSQVTFNVMPFSDNVYETVKSRLTLMLADLVVDAANNLTAKLVVNVDFFNPADRPKVNFDGNDIILNAGDLRVSVAVQDWPFCAPCEKSGVNMTGSFLDVVMKVAGSAAASQVGTSNVYSLGGWTTYTVSNQVVSGRPPAAQTMPSPYPSHTTSGSDDLFTSRLAAFEGTAKFATVGSLGRNMTFADKVDMKTLGNSGKTTYFNKDKPEEKITIEPDNLKEKMADGGKITEQGHSFNTFASQQFVINLVGETTLQNIAVKQTTFTTELKGNSNAKLTFDTFLFLDDGDITNQGETYSMRAGAMKFNIKIDDWQFCGEANCRKGTVGEFLDFEIVIKGKGDEITKKANNEYDLGYGTLKLSNKVLIDGNNATMPDGYPQLVIQGSKKIFQFRFPKFTNMVYDPTAELNNDEGGNGGGDDNTDAGCASIASMGVLLLCLIYSMLM